MNRRSPKPSAIVETARGSVHLILAMMSMLAAACWTTSSSSIVDRHNPEAVLRAYFDAWSHNDSSGQQTFMTANNVKFFPEPVESVNVLSLGPFDDGSARPESETRVYLVTFDYQPKGHGFSMERGRYTWTYTLIWNAKRDSWLISNYGAG